MTELCVCETDENAPECRAKSPLGVEAELMGDFIYVDWHCTRGVGHDGDHVRCGGRGPHEMERWPQVAEGEGR